VTKPSISGAAPGELGVVAALMREVVSAVPYYNATAIAAELAMYTEDELQRRLKADPRSILVSRDAAGLTGFCISRFDHGTVWLDWFGVAPRARGQGIGGELLKALSATLPARGAHKIWCDSRSDNTESIAVLERFGFKRAAHLKDHWYHQDYYLWEWFPKG
jgi:RimJ/RimL family protein N-acetyltransferase